MTGCLFPSKQSCCCLGPVASGKDKVRLYGVDAPEKTQMCNDSSGRPYACGQISLEALKQRVGTRPVRCEVSRAAHPHPHCLCCAHCLLLVPCLHACSECILANATMAAKLLIASSMHTEK